MARDETGNSPSGPTRESNPVARRLFKEFYFPTQVYFTDLPEGPTLNRVLKRFVRSLRKEDPAGIVRSNLRDLGAWHSTTDIHLKPALRPFLDVVTEVVQHIFNDLGYDPGWPAACDNMWANISPPHAYNRHHTHPGVLWSGVYYVQAPKGSGRIYFHDPRVQAHVLRPRFAVPEDGKRAKEVWTEVYFEPIAGRLILFPAWLGHEVQPNLSRRSGPAGERISISFNYYQKRSSAEFAESARGAAQPDAP